MEMPKPKQRPWGKIIVHPGNNKSTTIFPGQTKVPQGSYNLNPPTYNRTERDPFYHTNRWKKASARFLKQNPLCACCGEKGIIRGSQVTDHIIPKQVCKDPWDESNWQPLCKPCHKDKSAKDKVVINNNKKK